VGQALSPVKCLVGQTLSSVILALALVPAVFASAASEAFDHGMAALGNRDWDQAVDLLEAALSADPDNVRYGSEYRQAVILRAKALHPKEGKPEDWDRSLKFFEQLVTQHTTAANAYLNYGFAIVDKIPAAGAVTQVILANTALGYFTKSIEIKPSWSGYYTRGNAYLYWPKVFGRAKLGVADLEEAMKIQQAGPKKPYYVRVWVSLGDAYWKVDDLPKATETWTNALKEFPDSDALKQRLAKQGDELKEYLDDVLDPSKRVDTNLKDLWTYP
jgi:tetratricopeptide (TPR) repeat protein